MNWNLGSMRCARLVASVLAISVLASCGGGTQVERFVATRVVVFGDESSVIDQADGRKYTVNALKTDTAGVVTPDCNSNPIWIQYLVGLYGLVLRECNTGGATAAAQIYAASGAKVADLAAQIAAAGAFDAKTLATVWIGANDVVALYAQYPAVSEDALTGQAQAAASVLASQVAAIVKAGGKVVFATVPNLGHTPYAAKENAAHLGEDRAALLTRLTTAFNNRLRRDISGSGGSFVDGHQGVQVLADEYFDTIIRSFNAGSTTTGYLNIALGICDPTLATTVHDCTTSTLLTATSTPNALVSGGTIANYLWADDLHLSPGGQSALGLLASSRVNANPL